MPVSKRFVVGTYWLYAAIAAIGIFTCTIIIPETKGKSLEEIEELFSKGWIHFSFSKGSPKTSGLATKNYELLVE